MPRVDEYASTSGLDNDDTLLSLVDGALKNVPLPSARGYIDASHYSDLNEQVINNCETITGFTTTVAPTLAIQLDPTIKVTGSNSVVAVVYMSREPTPSAFYWNAPSDVTVGNYAEITFALRTTAQDDAPYYVKAFVASGVDRTGTVNYADDFYLQFPNDIFHNNTWYYIRIPLTGLTAVRSVGIVQRLPAIPANNGPAVGFWFDDIKFREATGIDRAVYTAPANTHIVIPATYTSAKTQLPIFRESAGVTWEDRRT